MYKNDNTARKINQNFEQKSFDKKRKKVIKLKKIKKANELKRKLITFCISFSAFSVTCGGIFYFLFGQAKLNELTYKINKNTENSEEKEKKIVFEKNTELNLEKSRVYATEDKAIIY